MNKYMRQFHDFTPYSEDDVDIENELMGKSDEAVSVYASYMTEIISAFVFFSKPNVDIELVLPAIKDSAAKIIKMTKFFIEVRFKMVKLSSCPLLV